MKICSLISVSSGGIFSQISPLSKIRTWLQKLHSLTLVRKVRSPKAAVFREKTSSSMKRATSARIVVQTTRRNSVAVPRGSSIGRKKSEFRIRYMLILKANYL
uniref:(northern house mosquito) hypothetical protein n=1 Tax=Culex pipiens TaxID=7175 RepID=A0A8D8FVC7_CULPI